ncbi:hypothetical protein MTBLM1_130042 [Rhodospirillaceae bacterium LM-1]|nr:hypothetical protein MTBLM1_130042 [Rhodospirillaceae bacterium LM-1]
MRKGSSKLSFLQCGKDVGDTWK